MLKQLLLLLLFIILIFIKVESEYPSGVVAVDYKQIVVESKLNTTLFSDGDIVRLDIFKMNY